MNKIEKLNECIAQLTDLVKSGKETISATEEMLKLAEQERDRLADQRRKSEPKFERVDKGENYYYIGILNSDGTITTSKCWEEFQCGDNERFKNNNYFKTVQRAEEIADKINFLLRLERLHDTFCPDYVPDWNDNEYKYCVFYDNTDKRYRGILVVAAEYKTNVYFATAEIAQKVCDILNAELEGKK